MDPMGLEESLGHRNELRLSREDCAALRRHEGFHGRKPHRPARWRNVFDKRDVLWLVWLFVIYIYTCIYIYIHIFLPPRKTEMTMEHQPFEEVFAILKWWFSVLMLVFRVVYLAYLLRLFLIGGLFGGGFFTRVLVRFGGKSCWWQRHKQYKSRAEKRTPKSSNEKRTPGCLLGW